MKGAFVLSYLRGFQARSLNWQRRTQARERTSDGQPENIVGSFCTCATSVKHPELKYALCRSCRRLRSFDLDLDLEKQNQKIAAFGSSYRGIRCQTDGSGVSCRHC